MNNQNLPQVGDTYQWGSSPLSFTVYAVRETPDSSFKGNRTAPYLTVAWSDRPNQLESYSLASFQNDLRLGNITKVEVPATREAPKNTFSKGDNVWVLTGPLSGQQGTVIWVSEDGYYAGVKFLFTRLGYSKVNVDNLKLTI